MTLTQSGSARSVLRELREQYPESPFLALGQTVFWDEPVKAVLRRMLDDAGIGGHMVVGVHDTDYFAKTPIRRAGPGRFDLLPHNDGSTRDLWSAAGEVSTLFGSETFPKRHDFMKYGVPFDRLAHNHAEGRGAFQDEHTEAWGWRGLVYTGSRNLIVSRLPLKDVGAGVLEMLAWGFNNAILQIAPDCCCNEAHAIADRMTGWCRDFCQAHPDLFLTDLFQYVLPRIYTLLLRAEPENVTVAGTARLLRFAPDTVSLPRFRFVDLFLRPQTRDIAMSAYNAAVAGSNIYTLDKFGAGALPFDIIAPGHGRGTLRITPRVVFVETPQPIAIGLRRPVESLSDLAEALTHKLGDQITLVGKAVTLVAMLAQEFIFVFNEEGSMYVSRTRRLNDTLASNGIALDMRPILRMRYETWDALSAGKSTLRLPEHLASTFGRATITTPEFAESWRSVIEEQKALCALSAGMRKPRELLAYLHNRFALDAWDASLEGYNAAKGRLRANRERALEAHNELHAAYAHLEALHTERMQIESDMARHFHSVADWTDEALARRQEFQACLEALNSQIRAEKARAASIKRRALAIERCPDAMDARKQLNDIELRAEMARLTIIRNALLTIDGLSHTNHRPSAWWLPMVDSTGDWFRKIVSTTQVYMEPLLSRA